MPLFHLDVFIAWTRTIPPTRCNIMWLFNKTLRTISWFRTEKEENFTCSSRNTNITLGKAVQYNRHVGILLSNFLSQMWTENAEVTICVRSRPYEIFIRGTTDVNVSGPIIFYSLYLKVGGTRWHSWLRQCATNRKVAGSIPDGVIGIFDWHIPSCCTMSLGLTQPLTEMSTSNISWKVKAAGV